MQQSSGVTVECERAHRGGGTNPSGFVPAYTIASLVTDKRQYRDMRDSMEKGGFTTQDCEYLFIDNSEGNQCNAYTGLNLLLGTASGKRIVFCHQDVLLIDDGRRELDARLEELTEFDPYWGVAGNAGGISWKRYAFRISDPNHDNRSSGPFPARVQSVDENFFILRRECRLGFSRDLDGYHMYGADICLVADILGWNSYVIDFHLRHLSAGKVDAEFYRSREAFTRKWTRALRKRALQTTCTYVMPGYDKTGAFIHLQSNSIRRRLKRKIAQIMSLLGN